MTFDEKVIEHIRENYSAHKNADKVVRMILANATQGGHITPQFVAMIGNSFPLKEIIQELEGKS